jgi:hypothetical protein
VQAENSIREKKSQENKEHPRNNALSTNSKLHIILSNGHDRKMYQESLAGKTDFIANMNASNYKDLLFNTFIYYRTNLNELICPHYLKKYENIYNSMSNNDNDSSTNQTFYGINNFSYDYFHFTTLTILKKFNSTHKALSQQILDFDKKFDELDGEGKIFITKIVFLNNNISQLRKVAEYYSEIFKEKYNLERYSEKMIEKPELKTFLSNFHIILRFFGHLPYLLQEEFTDVILNLYRTMTNLSGVILKNSDRYFEICKPKELN